MTPNDPYSGRTAPLTSKRCILYMYSTNTGTEYFKHGTFIILTYLVPVLFTFYIQCAKIKKKNNSGAKRLMLRPLHRFQYIIIIIIFINCNWVVTRWQTYVFHIHITRAVSIWYPHNALKYRYLLDLFSKRA